jgi:hypothetical protein
MNPLVNMSEDAAIVEVPTKRCGNLKVLVQGDVSEICRKAVFLTLHDLGCNATSFRMFVDHISMRDVKQRSVFIHVNFPGQEDNAPDLPAVKCCPTSKNKQQGIEGYPKMQTIAEDLLDVVDFFGCPGNVTSARLTLHSTKLRTKLKIFRKIIFFGTKVSEAFLSISQNLKVTRL